MPAHQDTSRQLVVHPIRTGLWDPSSSLSPQRGREALSGGNITTTEVELRGGSHQPQRAFGSLEDHRDLRGIELVMRHHPEGVTVRASYLHSV